MEVGWSENGFVRGETGNQERFMHKIFEGADCSTAVS